MSKKLFTILSALLLATMLLGACGPQPTEAPERTLQHLRHPKNLQRLKSPWNRGFTIGISNPFISSEYRTQMIAELIEVNQEYMAAGRHH